MIWVIFASSKIMKARALLTSGFADAGAGAGSAAVPGEGPGSGGAAAAGGVRNCGRSRCFEGSGVRPWRLVGSSEGQALGLPCDGQHTARPG